MLQSPRLDARASAGVSDRPELKALSRLRWRVAVVPTLPTAVDLDAVAGVGARADRVAVVPDIDTKGQAPPASGTRLAHARNSSATGAEGPPEADEVNRPDQLSPALLLTHVAVRAGSPAGDRVSGRPHGLRNVYSAKMPSGLHSAVSRRTWARLRQGFDDPGEDRVLVSNGLLKVLSRCKRPLLAIHEPKLTCAAAQPQEERKRYRLRRQ